MRSPFDLTRPYVIVILASVLAACSDQPAEPPGPDPAADRPAWAKPARSDGRSTSARATRRAPPGDARRGRDGGRARSLWQGDRQGIRREAGDRRAARQPGPGSGGGRSDRPDLRPDRPDDTPSPGADRVLGRPSCHHGGDDRGQGPQSGGQCLHPEQQPRAGQRQQRPARRCHPATRTDRRRRGSRRPARERSPTSSRSTWLWAGMGSRHPATGSMPPSRGSRFPRTSAIPPRWTGMGCRTRRYMVTRMPTAPSTTSAARSASACRSTAAPPC